MEKELKFYDKRIIAPGLVKGVGPTLDKAYDALETALIDKYSDLYDGCKILSVSTPMLHEEGSRGICAGVFTLIVSILYEDWDQCCLYPKSRTTAP